jgi:glycosyltransferase involved in cell wall biosynthesis
MNILIWSPFIQKVGTTTNVEGLVYSLTKYSKKYQIDLINVFGEWDNYEFESENVKKISLLKLNFIKENKKNGFIRSRLNTIIIILCSFIPLLRLLNKKNYDFIFAHLITSLPILLVSLIKQRAKLILSIAGFPKLTFLRSFFWKSFERNIFKVVCPSQETKDLLLEKKIFNDDKLKVIKDPHISVINILKKKKSVVSNHKLIRKNNIISIGRLTRQKNYIFLIEGFKQILNLKNNLHLTIIGDGEDRKKIENKIDELNINKHVTLAGFQKNIYNYLENSICYISSSLWEGPDLAMLDAAFMNVPLICSDCKSGRKEFINNNKRGYIFKTNDMSSFVKTFEQFLNEDQINLKKKILESKKEIKNFTRFRYFKQITSILEN